MEIILTLRKEYEGGIFSVNLGYRRVTIMSDFEKVQACLSHFISKASKQEGNSLGGLRHLSILILNDKNPSILVKNSLVTNILITEKLSNNGPG